jgi:hypothetical protein
MVTAPTHTPDAELDALCDWLRDRLRDGLAHLRGDAEHPPRAELDVLLAARDREALAAAPIPATLANLCERFDVRTNERALLAALLACAVAPELGRALGLLYDPLARDVPTFEALAALLGLPRTYRLTGEDAVIKWSLVTDRPPALALDPMIEARLLGRVCRDRALVDVVTVIPRAAPLPGWPIDAVVAQIHRAIAGGARSVRLWFRDVDGSGRRTLFAAVAHRIGCAAASVAAGASPDDVRASLRLARLENLAIAWHDRVRLPNALAMPVLQAWLDPDHAPPPIAGVADITVRMPAPDRAAREAAWRAIVPAFASWSDADQRALLDGWNARPGQLAAIALRGVTDAADAMACLRGDATLKLEGHCEVLETTFEWDDLVLPAPTLTSLRELANEARVLPRLWTEPALARLFPHGRAVAALFCGPPGTGKTMAAQVIARELGLPLFRIDLSRIVSKYIGETSQNLARVLGAARHTDAVVFFDEADALFSKRTDVSDAHDRYANTETDYLLQALDAWRGLAILATNKRGNIDSAFLRRMRLILEFPRAEAAERERIWTRLGATLLGDQLVPLSPLIARAARDCELSGAQIKGALLTARAAAGSSPATAVHVVRGIERELEKEGRGLSMRDKHVLHGDA